MNRVLTRLPILITVVACVVLVVHGPIAQLPHYHEFADQSVAWGVPHAADVFSNAGFALVGLLGWFWLALRSDHPAVQRGWAGYRLFLLGLLMTAAGSSFYHLAPDNARLIWDRLPIAVACAGLLAGVRAETVPGADGKRDAVWLAMFAVGSVAWWYFTEQKGEGDLRPYLLLQGLPLILIPLWQAIYRAPRLDRIWFGAALMLYVCAKLAELYDHELLTALGWISGHTMKHLLAAAAAGVVVGRLAERTRDEATAGPSMTRIAIEPSGSRP